MSRPSPGSWLFALIGTLLSCTAARLPEAYRRGLQLEREGRHAAAVAAYREGARACGHDSPECRMCRLRLAETQARLGRHQEAVQSYRDLGAWTRDPATAARARERAAGVLEDHLRRPDRAFQLCLEVVLTFPAEVAAEDAFRRLLRLYPATHGGGDAALIRLLLRLHRRLARSPLADTILFAAARIYRKDRAAGQALALYDRVWADHPKGELADDALWEAAQILEEQERWTDALDRYRRLLATRKDAFFVGSYNSVHLDDAQLRVGQIKLEHLDDARGALEAFATLRDDFADSILRDDAQFWIAQIHLRQGDRAAACQALARLVRDFPDGNHVRRARELLGRTECAAPPAPQQR